MPGSSMSLRYRARPVTFSSASVRRTDWPTILEAARTDGHRAAASGVAHARMASRIFR